MVSGGDNRTILKPRNDDRTYKQVVLSNGLQVLLVSDPDTDKVCLVSWLMSQCSFFFFLLFKSYQVEDEKYLFRSWPLGTSTVTNCRFASLLKIFSLHGRNNC